VLFDDVQVEYRQGLLVQETQYDPWGLSLTGINYATPGLDLFNKRQFNDKEQQDDLGLDLLDYGARLYSGALARFSSVDPKVDLYSFWSPYLYAANNPLRFEDYDGEGPGDRVKAARNQVAAGNTYRQEGGNLRIASTSEALRYMDCSEFVSRVLAADQITPDVESRNTGALVSYLGNQNKFNKSTSPHFGDVVLWYNSKTGKGHTGVVSAVDGKNPKKFKLIHATYGDRPSQENSEFATESQYSRGHYDLVGYFSPVNETPDGKLDGSTQPVSEQGASSQASTEVKPTASKNSAVKKSADEAVTHFKQQSWFRHLDASSQSLILDAYRKKKSSNGN
jgi:RHS repeat-associated protein